MNTNQWMLFLNSIIFAISFGLYQIYGTQNLFIISMSFLAIVVLFTVNSMVEFVCTIIERINTTHVD